MCHSFYNPLLYPRKCFMRNRYLLQSHGDMGSVLAEAVSYHLAGLTKARKAFIEKTDVLSLQRNAKYGQL